MKKFLILILVFTFLSCSKEEGYGGLSTIKGKVFGKDFNTSNVLVSQDFIGGMKVYISKHNNPNYFDRLDTSYDGSFKFEFLQPGKYDIWVFGDCDSCSWDQIYQLITVEVAKKEEKDIGIIEIIF